MRPTSSVQDPHIELISSPHGLDIPVRVYGKDARGTPVLMTHGLQSHSGWFVQSAIFIAGLGLPVYLIDRRGSGLSEGKRGSCRNFMEFIEDIETVACHAMDLHGKDKVHVLGHCLGALSALAYAAVRPHEMKSLVLTTPGIYTLADLSLRQKTRVAWSKLTGREIHLPVPLEAEQFSDVEEYTSFIKNDALSLREVTGSFYFEVLRVRSFIRRHRGKITMPVFMACAGRDPICDNARNRHFFEALQSERKMFRMYDRARHVLEFSTEKYGFFDDIRRWFESLGEAAL